MSGQINLFNPVFLKTEKVFSAVALIQAFGLVMLGSVAMAIYVVYQSNELIKNADIVTAQLRVAEVQVAKLRAMVAPTGAKVVLEQSLSKLESDIQNRQKIATILQTNDFGNTKGYSAYLAAFARQIPAGLWLTGFNITGGGNEVALQGRSLRPDLVPLYVTQLKREAVMQGKSFSALQIHLPTMNDEPIARKMDAGKPAPYAAYVEFDLRSSDSAEKNAAAEGNGK
jgi:Tfp pilus assembly protein PilN